MIVCDGCNFQIKEKWALVDDGNSNSFHLHIECAEKYLKENSDAEIMGEYYGDNI